MCVCTYTHACHHAIYVHIRVQFIHGQLCVYVCIYINTKSKIFTSILSFQKISRVLDQFDCVQHVTVSSYCRCHSEHNSSFDFSTIERPEQHVQGNRQQLFPATNANNRQGPSQLIIHNHFQHYMIQYSSTWNPYTCCTARSFSLKTMKKKKSPQFTNMEGPT